MCLINKVLRVHVDTLIIPFLKDERTKFAHTETSLGMSNLPTASIGEDGIVDIKLIGKLSGIINREFCRFANKGTVGTNSANPVFQVRQGLIANGLIQDGIENILW